MVAVINALKAARSPFAARASSGTPGSTLALPCVLQESSDDLTVEHLSLLGRQDRPHLEHMGDGRLLEIAHGDVEMIDRRLDLRTRPACTASFIINWT